MNSFDDDFFSSFDSDEISTIFYSAKQKAEIICCSSACAGMSKEDTVLMATSFSIAIELLRRYHNANQE